jgi:outer membrane protein assembly factor BamD (BamD/ComL family)
MRQEPQPPAQTLTEDTGHLEEIAQKQSDQSMRAKSHLELARLYSSHKNPNLDYQRALKELEMYLSLNPDDAETDEIQNLLAILRELDRVTEENRKSRQKVNQLTKENKELKASVKELKNLDIKIEEKRRRVK